MAGAPLPIRRIRAGVPRVAWPRASAVAPARGPSRRWTPRQARQYARRAAPAPAPVWPWPSRGPAPGSSRAHAGLPWVPVTGEGSGPERAAMRREHTPGPQGACGRPCGGGTSAAPQGRRPPPRGGGRGVRRGLKARPPGMTRGGREAQRTGQAGGRRALGHPAPPQHPPGRAWPRLGAAGPRQPGVIALAGLPTVGGHRPVGTAQAPCGVPTVGACQPARGAVAFPPTGATTILPQLGTRDVTPGAIRPHRAR
jgi:hypothetical protein